MHHTNIFNFEINNNLLLPHIIHFKSPYVLKIFRASFTGLDHAEISPNIFVQLIGTGVAQLPLIDNDFLHKCS